MAKTKCSKLVKNFTKKIEMKGKIDKTLKEKIIEEAKSPNARNILMSLEDEVLLIREMKPEEEKDEFIFPYGPYVTELENG